MVITLDFDSSYLGSSPSRSTMLKFVKVLAGLKKFSYICKMNWVFNGKYVLARVTQTQLEKVGLLSKCTDINRAQLKKFSKYIPDDCIEHITFIARILDGKINVSKPMYFVN